MERQPATSNQAVALYFVFSHDLDRPARYGESRRFATTPSTPIAAVAAHIAGPSPLEVTV